MSRQNFIAWEDGPFSDRVIEAAREGRLGNTWAVLDIAAKTVAVSRGLQQICRIAKLNRLEEIAWSERDDDESADPPLPAETVESLLSLGEVAAQMLASEVERLGGRLEGDVKERAPAADLSVAAQAAVARGRSTRSVPAGSVEKAAA